MNRKKLSKQKYKEILEKIENFRSNYFELLKLLNSVPKKYHNIDMEKIDKSILNLKSSLSEKYRRDLS